jgi:hypothetical protein
MYIIRLPCLSESGAHTSGWERVSYTTSLWLVNQKLTAIPNAKMYNEIVVFTNVVVVLKSLRTSRTAGTYQIQLSQCRLVNQCL